MHLNRHKALSSSKPYSHVLVDLHMFRIVPIMALYLKMGKTQGWGYSQNARLNSTTIES